MGEQDDVSRYVSDKMDAWESYCEHCEMPRAICVHGNPPKPETWAATGPSIRAKFNGTCSACGGEVTEGDAISPTEDGWVHSEEVSHGNHDRAERASAPPTPEGLFDEFI